MFHFSTTKGSNTTTFGCILLPTLASYTFTFFTYCKHIALLFVRSDVQNML